MSGLIVKIDPEDLSITPVARIGLECEGQHEDVICGRPLGLEFTPDGDLLVCDAVLGLHLVKFNQEQVLPFFQRNFTKEQIEKSNASPISNCNKLNSLYIIRLKKRGGIELYFTKQEETSSVENIIRFITAFSILIV